MTRTTQDGGGREVQPEDAEDLDRGAAFVDERHLHRRPIDDADGINPTRRQGTGPHPEGRERSTTGRRPGEEAP